jgi:hypothetical protein
MKKTIIMAMLILASYLINAQEFMGIKVDGKVTDVVEKFKSKGFYVTDFKLTNYTMKGTLGNRDIDLYIYNTLTSRLVWQFVIYLPKKDSWISLENEYEEFFEILKQKYGEPSSQYSFFETPYTKGDGNELSAVDVEKCHYAAFWDNVFILISKYNKVKIAYENKVNAKIYETQKNENLKNSL